MSADANVDDLPGPDAVKRLLKWRPEAGVISAYVCIDRADRGQGWLSELKDAIRGLESAEHAKQISDLRATADGVLERFSAGPPPPGRGQVGFVEVGGRKRQSRWYASQLAPRRTEVHNGGRPFLRPLVELLERGGRIGVATLSAKRVHLWEWDTGLVRQLQGWALDTPEVPPSGDEFEHRLRVDGGHFLAETGKRSREEVRRRGWRELLAFGPSDAWKPFSAALGDGAARHVDQAELIDAGAADIEARVEALLPELEQAREAGLVKQVTDAAYSGKERASLGPQETLEALAEGRVEQLLFDAERDYRGEPIEKGLAYEPPEGAIALPVAEILIERALETSARVTPVFGEAASSLDEHDGVVAQLRY